MDELREFHCITGITYLIPKRHCAFCKHCGDIFCDYTNGPYLFLCEKCRDQEEN